MAITKQANLTVHMRPHTGYKPYQCSQCESDLAKKNLKRHLRSHTC